jgi:TrpR-related protein YerC/YecD
MKIYEELVARGLIAQVTNEEECALILEDLCTVTEIQAMAQRLEVAKMLRANNPYTDIVDATRASSTTVSRVSRCLNYGNGGYHIIFNRIEDKK